MYNKFLTVLVILLIYVTSIKSQGIVLDEGKTNDGNLGFITKQFTDNPKKDRLVKSNFVFKLIKNAGPDSKNWHGIELNQKVKLSAERHVLELNVLFLPTLNNMNSTTLALWMGSNKNSELRQKIEVSKKWQTVKFDYSTLPEFKKVFDSKRDTVVNKVIFLPRREDDKQNAITLYIDKLVFL